MQINTSDKVKASEPKTRKEVMLERKVEKKTKKNKHENRIPEVLKKFYAEKGHDAKFVKRNGQMIEI